MLPRARTGVPGPGGGRTPLCTRPPGLRPTRRLSDACAAQAEGPQLRLPTEDATERRLALRGSPTPGAPHLVVQVEEVGVLLPDVGLGVGDELADVPVGTRGAGVPLCGRSPRRTMTREPHPPGGPPAEPGAAESRAGPGLALGSLWQGRGPRQRHARPEPQPAPRRPPRGGRHRRGAGRPLTRTRRCLRGCPAGSAHPSPCSASGTAAASPCKTAALRAAHAPHTAREAARPSPPETPQNLALGRRREGPRRGRHAFTLEKLGDPKVKLSAHGTWPPPLTGPQFPHL